MPQIIAERTQADVVLPLAVSNNGGVPGLNATAAVRDGTTLDSYLDWADSTFKTSGWTTKQAAMSDIGDGFYTLTLDLSVVTNLPVNAHMLVVEYRVSGAVNGVAKDHITLVNTLFDVSSAAAVAALQADADDIQTRLPATLNGGRVRAHVEAMDADVIGAAQIASGAITSTEAPALANLDAAVSTRSAPGDAMGLTAGAVDQVWDEPLAGHAIVGTTGAALGDTAASSYRPNVMASFAFDQATNAIDGNVWLVVEGQLLTSVTSASAEFYGSDGTLLFPALTDLAPDAQGVFHVSKVNPDFSPGEQIYCRLAIVTPSGTYTSLKGLQVVG